MEKDLEYWKNNCEDDYLHTPISVLRYIKELEDEQNRKAAMLNPPNLDDVMLVKGAGNYKGTKSMIIENSTGEVIFSDGVWHEEQLTCKDCYYAGFDKCDHVKKLTKKQK